MRPRVRGVILLTLLAAGRAEGQVVAITNGTVYPVSSPKLERATVLLRDGRIEAVGQNVPVPSGATVVDAAAVRTGCTELVQPSLSGTREYGPR